MTMVEAINGALRDAMVADDRVLVFGEDVGRQGGVFRVTDGLQPAFGRQRCFDTPLAESAIVGVAVGMALRGLRPVPEIQFDGFTYPAFDQMVSHLAKYRAADPRPRQHAGDDPCALVRRGGCRRAPLGVHRDLLGAQRRPPCGGALDAG